MAEGTQSQACPKARGHELLPPEDVQPHCSY